MEDLSGVFLKSFSAEDVPAFFERTMQRFSQDFAQNISNESSFPVADAEYRLCGGAKFLILIRKTNARN
jgi:hypothetical protein